MSKKKSLKKRKVANLAAQNAQKSVNRKGRNKQKRQSNSQFTPKPQPKSQSQSVPSKPQQSPEKQEIITDNSKLTSGQLHGTPLEATILENNAIKATDGQLTDNPAQNATKSNDASPKITQASPEVAHASSEPEAVQAVLEAAPTTNQLSNASSDAPAHLPAPANLSGSDPQDSRKRRKLSPLIWWIVGMALAIGVVFAWLNHTNSEPNADQTSDSSSSENPTEGASTESPAENPEEPTPEAPSESTESPEETSPETKPSAEGSGELDPIAPRPPHDDLPEVTPGSRLIALTFDDGPSPANTPRLLDILSERNAKATFFVLGNLAERNPAILQRQAAEGHEVASHTPYHDQLTSLTAEQVRWQALEMDRIFTNILGTVPPFTRPPYGSVNTMVQNALGQPMIVWSVDPRDWQDRNSATVCNRVVSAAFDGAIVLMHDIHATTVDAVPCIIDNLRARGYEFLTVSDLAAARDVPLVNGQLYYSF